MKASKTRITGIDKVYAFLERIPEKYSKRFITTAFKQASKPLVKQAKRNAPKQTGLLKKSIGVVKARSKNMPSVLVMPVQSKRFAAAKTKTGKHTLKAVSKKALKEGRVKRKDSSRAWYAHFLTGTRKRKTKKGSNRGRISGINYMEDAQRATENEVERLSRQLIVKEIEKEAKKRGYKHQWTT